MLDSLSALDLLSDGSTWTEAGGRLLCLCAAIRICILLLKLWRTWAHQTSQPERKHNSHLLTADSGGILRLSNLQLSGCNQSFNLCCSSYSTSFLVTLSVHPSLPFCPSGCHCVTIITYFISLWFHFWWRLARVAFLSLVTFISVRPLLGCGATFFMARMSWAICFPPCSPLRPCHGLVRLSRKNSLWI